MSDSRYTPSDVARYFALRVPNLKVTQGKEWRGKCPVHGGDRDSFAVNAETGQSYCHSECSQGWSLEQLEAKLQNVTIQEAGRAIRRLLGRDDKKVCAVYPYTDENGNVLFEAVRFEPKGFTQRRRVNGHYEYALGDVRRVLYHLPQVTKAQSVIVCEGEKDVHTLEQLGFTATTNPMGAGKWRVEYGAVLKGKHVVILPDNDPPGFKHAVQIAHSVIKLAKSVRVIKPPAGKDVSDWVAAGGTAAKLKELISQAQVQTEDSIARWQSEIDFVAAKKDDKDNPFRVTPKGIIYVDPDPDKLPIKLCGPLTIAAKTRDGNGEDWGRLLQWKDDDGRQHQWPMPMSILAGDGREAVERLLAGGLHIGAGQRAKSLLNQYLQTYPVETRARCVTRIGWVRDCFVLPETTIGNQEHEAVIYQSAYDTEHCLNVNGSIEDWRNNVARLVSGNSRLLLAVACGFAGPVLSLLGAESGGLHFCGNTSSGKSTALVVGGSVCGGGGQNGFVQSWRATTNGLEATACNHNDLTLFLDELAQVDAKDAAETAYLLANGAGKARMTRTISSRKKLTWKMLFVSAGEVTLADHAMSKGKVVKGGAEIRLLTVQADAGAGQGLFEDTHDFTPEEFSRRLKSAAMVYYGQPLRTFLSNLLQRKSEWTKYLRQVQTKFFKDHLPAKAGGEVSRSLSRFAVIAAAGEAATKMGITGWKEGEVECGIANCFDSWVDLRGTTQSSDMESAVRQVAHFIELHGSSRFQIIRGQESDVDQVVYNRAGFRTAGADVEYFVLPEVFRKEVCAGFDARIVAAELVKRGYMATGSGAHLYTPARRLPGLGQRRVYVLNSTLLEE